MTKDVARRVIRSAIFDELIKDETKSGLAHIDEAERLTNAIMRRLERLDMVWEKSP